MGQVRSHARRPPRDRLAPPLLRARAGRSGSGLDTSALLDGFARAGVIVWFGTVGYVLAPRSAAAFTRLASGDALAATQFAASLCLFGFYVLIVGLAVLRRRPIAKARGLRPRLEAAVGGFAVYALPFLPPSHLGPAGHAVSATLMAAGMALALVALCRLGRSFSIMAEARGLVTGGPYAIIRHPLYLAEAIANVGAGLQFAWLPAAALIAVQSLFQLRRMLNEESVLRRSFPEYGPYMRRTARLIPGVW